MSEPRTPYAATETALPAYAIADTPQDRPQRPTALRWTPRRHQEAGEACDRYWASSRAEIVVWWFAGYAAVALYDALAEIERLTTDVVQLRGLVESIQHAANADTMPADEALAVIRGLVEGVGR